MMVRKNIDINKEPTQEQIDMLMEASRCPVVFDDDNPEHTEEELAQFYRVSDKSKEENQKQTVTLSISRQALDTAKSFGNGYTAILSRILENALRDQSVIQRFL